jgi:hypothetical protein
MCRFLTVAAVLVLLGVSANEAKAQVYTIPTTPYAVPPYAPYFGQPALLPYTYTYPVVPSYSTFYYPVPTPTYVPQYNVGTRYTIFSPSTGAQTSFTSPLPPSFTYSTPTRSAQPFYYFNGYRLGW